MANQAQTPVVTPVLVLDTITTERLRTVVPVIPTAGKNMGKQMFVLNGKHWSNVEPTQTQDTIVFTVQQGKDGNLYNNVTGYTTESREMSVAQKIALLTSQDAAYSMAIASLLK